MNPSFAGRTLGALECTTPDRLEEVARLVTIGYKPGEVGRNLGITTVRASQLILQAKAKGLVEILQVGRNRVTREMEETRAQLARKAYEVVQRRLEHVVSLEPGDIDGRAVNEAFKALEKTEHTVESLKERGGQAPVQIAIFNSADMERANRASASLLGTPPAQIT